MVIRAGDRVADVLGRDESLIDVFAAVSPAFERLRNPAMRRVMARLVTVGQAARVAGVDPDHLLARLNAAAAGEVPGGPPEPTADLGAGGASSPDGQGDAGPSPAGTGTGASPADRPAALAAVPPERVVELDVREALRQGEEPFSRIMAAKREVEAGGALRLRAIFEPAPLYAVMQKQGFRHWTERLGDDDWVVWFWPGAGDDVAAAAEDGGAAAEDGSGAPSGGHPAAEGDAAGGDGVVVLDVRGLEPPEPMVRTLAALETLPVGDTLVQVNVREPRFLLPQLEALGFTWETRQQGPDLVRVFIRHREGEDDHD